MRALVAPFGAVAFATKRSVLSVTEHPWRWVLSVAALLSALIVVGLAFTLQRLPIQSVQRGFRGTGMQQNWNVRIVARHMDANRPLVPLPAVPPAGRTAEVAYKNIQVLHGADANEFLRLMGAFPNWIAPSLGCAYCHSLANMASDTLYTKTVARHMIEMTRTINTDWKSHVGNVGVTCYTCHRGHSVPQFVWFTPVAPRNSGGLAEVDTGQAKPAQASGLTELATDPFTPFLLDSRPIRVEGHTALPAGTSNSSTKQTEWTYGLMAHFGHSLGVGCTYCHNTRDFTEWDQGTPARVTAWYGIEMVRALNRQFMEPIRTVFPADRLGPGGDVPKINCLTCHQGAYKPFYGASELSAYPLLADKPTPYPANAGASP